MNGTAINGIAIAYYCADKSLTGYSADFNITAVQAKQGYRVTLTAATVSNPNCYIRISYPRLGNASLPLYLGVFLEGEGTFFVTDKTEQNIYA